MIKEILDKLKPDQKRLLMYAFENEFSQYITLPDNKFIGVNAHNIKHLQVEEQAGKWAYGSVKG